MGQKAKPNSDIDNTGNWLDDVYGDDDTVLFDELDEDVTDNFTSAINKFDPKDSANSFEVGLSTVTDPDTSAKHKIKVTASGDITRAIQAVLKQTAVIKSSNAFFKLKRVMQNFEYILNTSEANSITDYSALRMQIKPWAYNDHNTDSFLETPFSPSDVANLHAWWDVSDSSTVTKDGENRISKIDDKSGNANHLEQTTGSKQPLLVSADRNGLDVIHYDDTARSMTSDLGTVTQPITILGVVLVPTADALTHYWFDNKILASNDFVVRIKESDETAVITAFSGNFNYDITPELGTWVYCTTLFSTSSSTFRLAGTEKASGTVGSNDMTDFRMGSLILTTKSLLAKILLSNQ